jgi:hypothetical protein
MKKLPEQFSVYAKTIEEAVYICEKQKEMCDGCNNADGDHFYRFSPNLTHDSWGYASSSYLESSSLSRYKIQHEFTFEEFKSYFNKNICFQSDGTKETGQKIIEELEKLGAMNKGEYNGDSNSRYYFINSKGNLDMEWDIPEGYELISLKEEKIMKNRILTPVNATRIINIACSTWKPRLAEKWATNIVLNKDTEISEEFYQEMRKACTTDQNDLFDEIFGKDEQTIKARSLKYGEAIKLTEGTYEGRIILRTFAGIVDIHNPENTWSTIPDSFVGKKVKLTITHEEIK